LLLRHFDIGVWQVDFVDDRNEFEALLLREMDIGDSLGLHALGGIDDQQCPLAGCE
jgi:hypothetical protein